ncbi:hypothetical protein ART_1245 [Arthrobacter sp. PAMC 25486]|uniref:CDP-glycerol glycerophosphotransferase family protein n=1 Tax=Arthrobacter sp. PAMC 25486 TaxID=1494608 RepID=UPI000535C491|nr:CDP-glycerol glycerophosphotransferase family protein [Arthrobacter sp. PAMC 25486]AIY00844.1 hypothetical protein ART_1245 [Arthrobacter sp. PAMC 25486]
MTKGLFSVVVALYGVVDYVDTFLNSLVRQSFPFEDLDIIIIDDASVDGSYDRVKEWVSKYPNVIRHTTKPNGGPASARNVGLDMAKNKWVTFCDPDDALQESYFDNVTSFIERDQDRQASILTTRVMIWQEKTGRISDNHPLARKYFFGERLVDLDKDPHNIQLGGASIFLRKSVIDEHDLRFDERIKPTFEDGEFIGRFMSYLEKPIVGLVSNARYLYRKRGDGSSLVQSGWGQAERYDHVLKYGYIGLLDGLREKLGYVPVWAQNMVLYDIQWYLSEDKKMNSSTAWLKEDQRLLLMELLRKTFTYIERDTIDSYNVTAWSWLTREAILTHFKGQGSKVKRAFLWSERDSSPTRIVYTYSGVLPDEKFMVNGESVTPIRTKSVEHSYYGETFVIERSIWLPTSNTPQVWINQEFVPFASPKRPGWTKPVTTRALKLAPKPPARSGQSKNIFTQRIMTSTRPIARHFQRAVAIRAKLGNRIAIDRLVFGGSSVGAATNVAKRVVSRKTEAAFMARQHKMDRATLAWAKSDSVQKKYERAWVVMDRIDKADDNGEHLYRFIAREHPEINAWFLLSKDSADWERLYREGFKLVDYGSRDAVALTLAADFQISSDATHGVQYPIDKKRFGTYSSKFVFLQHGVIKDDLSRWLNSKDLSMFVTSTKPEYESIAGSLSPYKFTADETKLTGLPRFDALVSKRQLVDPSDRRTIVVMPTWRQSLRDELIDAVDDAERKEVLENSEFGRNWFKFLRDERVLSLANLHQLEVVFIPHPAMNSLSNLVALPSYIEIFDSKSGSLQDLLAKSIVTITDYSSIAFDAAMVGSSIVYFQFDSDSIFSGTHSYRKGYYEYEADGFGPVFESVDRVFEGLDVMAANGFVPFEKYEKRVSETFAYMDTNNCQRVVESIRALGQ